MNAANDDLLMLDGSAMRVGIGTTSPASLLHVGSTAYELSSGAYLTSSHQRTAKMVIHADDANTDWDEQEIGLALHNEDPTNNNWSPHIAFTTHEDDDGDPTNANPVAVAAISATYNTRVANGWAKGDLVFFTNGGGSGNAERMRIDSAGNVGIGVTAPSAKLEVAGEIKTSLGNINTCVSYVYNRSDMDTNSANLKATTNDDSSSQNHWGFIMPKSGTVKMLALNTRAQDSYWYGMHKLGR